MFFRWCKQVGFLAVIERRQIFLESIRYHFNLASYAVTEIIEEEGGLFDASAINILRSIGTPYG
jgi:hypothetical protein